jgi:hypothetical protein
VSDRPPPWASVADIGQFGLETAAAVVERLLTMTRLAFARHPAGFRLPLLPATAESVQARQLRAEAERLIDLYAEWTRSLVQVAVDATNTDRAVPDRLSVGPVAPGGSTGATVWLHVLDGPAAAPIRLMASNLIAHHGGSIPASAVSFTPPTLDTTSPRSREEVALRVRIPEDAAPGPYHGHILAVGMPEVCLEVLLEVLDE